MKWDLPPTSLVIASRIGDKSNKAQLGLFQLLPETPSSATLMCPVPDLCYVKYIFAEKWSGEKRFPAVAVTESNNTHIR